MNGCYVRGRVQCAVNIQSAELESKVEHAMWQQKCFSGGRRTISSQIDLLEKAKTDCKLFYDLLCKIALTEQQPQPEPHKKKTRSNNLFSSESFVVWASTFGREWLFNRLRLLFEALICANCVQRSYRRTLHQIYSELLSFYFPFS